MGAESWQVSCALILELNWRLCLAEAGYSYSVKFRMNFLVSGHTQSPNSSLLAALLVKKQTQESLRNWCWCLTALKHLSGARLCLLTFSS